MEPLSVIPQLAQDIVDDVLWEMTLKRDRIWDLLEKIDTNVKSHKEWAEDIINLLKK